MGTCRLNILRKTENQSISNIGEEFRMNYILIKTGLLLVLFLFVIGSTGLAEELTYYDDDWVKVNKVTPNLYQFIENGANSYLLIGRAGAVIIDGGFGVSNLYKLCRRLTKLPVSMINTHGHVDHVGSDQYFKQVYIHTADAGMIISGLDRRTRAWALNELKMSSNPLPSHFHPNTWNYPPVKPYYQIKGDEELIFGDLRLQIIQTPGHTPGSICIFDRAHKLLFTGDTLVPQIWIHLPESNYQDWLQSAPKLITLTPAVETILAGHGPVKTKEFLNDLATGLENLEKGNAVNTTENGIFPYPYQRTVLTSGIIVLHRPLGGN